MRAITTLDGECQIRKLLQLSIVNRPQVNLFKLTLTVTHVASCEEKGSGPRTIVCNNIPSDEYARLKFFTTDICGACDTSCPPNHLIATANFSEKSTNGIPPGFQRLRNLLNNRCNEIGDDRDVSDSLRRKIGRDTIDGDSLQDAVMAELETLFPELTTFGIDCADVARAGTCNCSDATAGPVYDGVTR